MIPENNESYTRSRSKFQNAIVYCVIYRQHTKKAPYPIVIERRGAARAAATTSMHPLTFAEVTQRGRRSGSKTQRER